VPVLIPFVVMARRCQVADPTDQHKFSALNPTNNNVYTRSSALRDALEFSNIVFLYIIYIHYV
jgi:hypothetical protein